jgi:hypothetical protein
VTLIGETFALQQGWAPRQGNYKKG